MLFSNSALCILHCYVKGGEKHLVCVTLSGYYGFCNIGDEAILEVIIGILRRQIPDVEIVVLSGNPVHTSGVYGVKAVSRTHLPSIIRSIRRSDLLISGGGGLLQDITSFRSAAYYLGIIEAALFMRKKVAVFAQGVGPLRHPLTLRWVKRTLNRVDLISVRDSLSAGLLAELGIKKNVRIAADPVFSLRPPLEEEIVSFWKTEGIETGKKLLQVGVALRPFPQGRHPGAEVFEIITRACLYLEKEYGARIIFLPYHLEKDLPLAREISSRLSRQNVIIDRALSAREVISLIGGLDLLLGMRLHALIFAAINGVSFVALPYDPKINAFLSTLGKKSLPSLEKLTIEQLIADLDLALSEKGRKDKSELAQKLAVLQEEVEKSALDLLALIT